jgi:hypothetical protein
VRVPLIEDRRFVTTPDGRELLVICAPKGALDLGPDQDWPEPLNWVTVWPGVLGIAGWFRNRFVFHSTWQVDVWQRGGRGQQHARLSTEDVPGKYAAADRVKALAAELAGTSPAA